MAHERHFSSRSTAGPFAVWAWRQRAEHAVLDIEARNGSHLKCWPGAPGYEKYDTPSARGGARGWSIGYFTGGSLTREMPLGRDNPRHYPIAGNAQVSGIHSFEKNMENL
jgi:hypothetical protein